MIAHVTGGAITPPYPALPVAVGEVAHVDAGALNVQCPCGNSTRFHAADRSGRLVSEKPGPAPEGLGEMPETCLAICADCGRVYDDAVNDLASTGTATIGSPVLARVNTTSPEWRRALALATEAGRADADASSCPRCGSAESFPALVSLHGQPTFVTRCAFCGTTRPFAPHPQEHTMTDTNERFDLPVTYGDGRVYIAHTVSGYRWNGYLCPAFTRDVADQIAADLARDEAQAPDEFRTLVRWNDELQAYLLQSAQYEEAGDPPEIVRGHDSRGVTVYSIGGGSWTWSAAETSPASPVH
ncbi:hypothetical protein [Leifsonia shinshuensis]|uniref:Uncharacterized protein n=1 Tax=Leifsonia shinshuensis TaxID=150026 RepID=A0A7G6YHB5_9MICO|nr:hypothetical protein [Leifsonia shinshuensis]QNE37880.1 hypothetical protein F1C12_21585 [Leifsonia shinshuensis]